MRVLIAPDKFKFCLSANGVAEALKRGLLQTNPDLNCVCHPMADGGEGSLEVLANHMELHRVEIETLDPLFRPIQTYYLHDDQAAYIELAKATGLQMLKESERNPMYCSSFGTGLIIKDAFERGFRQIFLFVGGSATHDLGTGILEALGVKFFSNGKALKHLTGKEILEISRIQTEHLTQKDKFKITILYDVKNPLLGPRGAAQSYAEQKGASKEEVQHLERASQHVAELVQLQLHKDISQEDGFGAAGGMAAGLQFLNSKLSSGFEYIANRTSLTEAISKADYVISGEGRIDETSQSGKVLHGIEKLCQVRSKELIKICGSFVPSSLSPNQLKTSIYSLEALASSTRDSIENARMYLEKIGQRIGEELKRR